MIPNEKIEEWKSGHADEGELAFEAVPALLSEREELLAQVERLRGSPRKAGDPWMPSPPMTAEDIHAIEEMRERAVRVDGQDEAASHRAALLAAYACGNARADARAEELLALLREARGELGCGVGPSVASGHALTRALELGRRIDAFLR